MISIDYFQKCDIINIEISEMAEFILGNGREWLNNGKNQAF